MRPGRVEVEVNEVLGRQIATSAMLRGHEARVFLHRALTATGRPARAEGEQGGVPSWAATARATCSAVNAWEPDAVLELHFNIVERVAADGRRMRDYDTCFAYHWPGSVRGHELARAASAACAAEIPGVRDRGAIPTSTTWSGAPLHVLQMCHAPVALVETHNGANYAHHAAFIDAVETGRLGRALAEYCAAAVAAWRS